MVSEIFAALLLQNQLCLLPKSLPFRVPGVSRANTLRIISSLVLSFLVFANKILFALQVYMPTSFDKSFGQQEVNKHLVHFSFWDTSGNRKFCFSFTLLCNSQLSLLDLSNDFHLKLSVSLTIT